MDSLWVAHAAMLGDNIRVGGFVQLGEMTHCETRIPRLALDSFCEVWAAVMDQGWSNP